MRSSRGFIAALIVLCQSSQSLAYAGIALFLPLIRTELGLTFTQSGLFAIATTATYAAMQIPAGYLADRFGAKRVFLIGTLGVNLTALGFALLPSFGWLLLDQAVSGVFRSLMFAPGMVLMARQFPPERRATAMGLFVALGFTSNIFLNTLGPILVGPLGWRNLFLIFAALGLLFLVVYWKTPEAPGTAQDTRPVRLHELAALMKERILWLCGGIQFVRLAVTGGTAMWLPTYLVADKGMSLQAAGLVLAAGALLSAPANFLGGYIADRFNRPVAVIAAALVLIGGTLLLIVQAQSPAALLVLVAVNQFLVQIYFGPLFDIPVRALGREFAGTISGFSNFWANVGALASLYLLGSAKDTLGSFDAGFFLLAGLCAAALLLAVPVSRDLTRRTTTTSPGSVTAP